MPSDNDSERLTPRQAAFVAEYLVDLNGTQAALRAGYAPNSANEQAVRLLADVSVSSAVERGKAQRNARLNIKQDDVLSEMSALALSRIDHYIVDDDGNVKLAEGAPDNAMAAVQSVKRKKIVKEDRAGNLTITYDVEIRLWDKPQPLKLTGRHVGLYPDKVEITGKGGGPIETVTEVRRTIVKAPDGENG